METTSKTTEEVITEEEKERLTFEKRQEDAEQADRAFLSDNAPNYQD